MLKWKWKVCGMNHLVGGEGHNTKWKINSERSHSNTTLSTNLHKLLSFLFCLNWAKINTKILQICPFIWGLWVGGSKFELKPHISRILGVDNKIYNFQIPRTTQTSRLFKTSKINKKCWGTNLTPQHKKVNRSKWLLKGERHLNTNSNKHKWPIQGLRIF